MSENNAQFHPAVEKVVETAGADIGRIKDEAVARDLAEKEEDIRAPARKYATEGDAAPNIKAKIEREIELAVARQAALDEGIHDAIAKGVVAEAHGDRAEEHDRQTKFLVGLAKDEAEAAVVSYHTLDERARQQQSAEVARKQIEDIPETE